MSRRLLGYAIRCRSGEWFDGTGLNEYSECPWTSDKAKRHLFAEAANAYRYAASYSERSKLRIVPIFAVRKPVVVPTQIATEAEARAFNALEPKPAPVVNPPCWSCGLGVEPGPEDDCLTDGERVKCGSCGLLNYVTATDDGVSMSDPNDDEDDEPKPAPVVARERYACWAGVCMWLEPDGEDDPRDTGTRAEAEARAAGIPGAKVVRILPDGEHEAAVAAAHKRGRAEAFATAAKVVRDTHDDLDERNESISMGLLANIADGIEELVRKEAAKGCAE